MAIARPEKLQAAGAALVFGLVAIGLRSERIQGTESRNEHALVPRDPVWTQEGDVDVSVQVQAAAETYLSQAIAGHADANSLETMVAMACEYCGHGMMLAIVQEKRVK